MRSTRFLQDRLHDIAEALCMDHEGTQLSLEQDRNKLWWLVGCRGGDCVLPRAQHAPTTGDALDAVEAWMAPELEPSQ